METGFKVVKQCLSNKYYHSVEGLNYATMTVYEVKNITTPVHGCGPLCVFRDFDSAVEFVYYYVFSSIFKCEFVRSKHESVWNLEGKKFHLSYLPNGTVLADQVTLLEEVEINEVDHLPSRS